MQEAEFHCRKAEADDATEIHLLCEQLGSPGTFAGIRSILQHILSAADQKVIVACNTQNKVVGWLHIYQTVRLESGHFCEIAGLIVDKSWRTRGIGKELINMAIEWSRDAGFSRLRVRTRKERIAADTFYSNLGFAKTKEQSVFDKKL